MSNLEIVRAWKDPEFRATLGGYMPDHPAGQIEFADPLLDRSIAASLEPLDLSSGHHCSTLFFTNAKCCK